MKNRIEQHLPLLISEDEKLFSDLMAKGKGLCPQVRMVAQAYENLNLGPSNDQVYNDIVRGRLSPIEEALIKDTTTRYEALNLRSDTILKEAVSGAYSLYNSLVKEVEKLRMQAQNYAVSFPLELISINKEGEPEISIECEEQLKERYCRVYLRTPQELSLHSKLQAAADACNEVWAEVKAHKASNLPYAAGYPSQLALMLQAYHTKEEKLALKPGFVNWVVARYEGNPMHAM